MRKIRNTYRLVVNILHGIAADFGYMRDNITREIERFHRAW